MPSTTNLAIPYPAGSDNPTAGVIAAVALAIDVLHDAHDDWAITVSQASALTIAIRYAKYKVVSKSCYWKFRVDIDSAGTGGQPITILLPPPTPKYTTSVMVRGIGTVDPLLNAHMGLYSPAASGTTMQFRTLAGLYTTALTASNTIYGHGQYEVA